MAKKNNLRLKQGPNTKVQITDEMLRDTEPIKCSNCGCTIFRQDLPPGEGLPPKTHQVKRISGLLVGSSHDIYFFTPARYCVKCFTPIESQP